MTLKKLFLGAVAGIALLGGGYTLAQTLVQSNISGNECWNTGQGPGGPSTGFLCTYLLRNGQALSVITGSGAVTQTMTPQQSTLMWHSTAPTSWTVTTPASPFDGEIIVLATDTTLTSLVTLTANTGQTLSATFSAQTITAATSAMWQYNYSGSVWYRVR